MNLDFRIRESRLQRDVRLSQGEKEKRTHLGVSHDGRSGVGIGAGSPGRRVVNRELVLWYIVLFEGEECDLAAVGRPPSCGIGREDLRDLSAGTWRERRNERTSSSYTQSGTPLKVVGLPSIVIRIADLPSFWSGGDSRT